ncbi:expressed unknown protein [Seminavis robusta]|uniref:Uncharacterized protein n=1 Tax=Seminavis robusta TaxID=568900 RepID=A0A9N8ESX9_9STRA|nr:expressed unknown protein [Seminavis robusta]|eukprot:Sro1607_g285590.1 n/a (195) ;mRNA; f:13914-14498
MNVRISLLALVASTLILAASGENSKLLRSAIHEEAEADVDEGSGTIGMVRRPVVRKLQDDESDAELLEEDIEFLLDNTTTKNVWNNNSIADFIAGESTSLEKSDEKLEYSGEAPLPEETGSSSDEGSSSSSSDESSSSSEESSSSSSSEEGSSSSESGESSESGSSSEEGSSSESGSESESGSTSLEEVETLEE